MFDSVAYAKSFEQVIFDINRTILNPLIQFAFIVAFVVFIWGVMQFIRNANSPDERKKGQDHMMWGIVGLVIMLGVFGIITIITRTFGINTTINNDQQTFTPPELKEIKIGH
jgi:hypothetical protein